MDIMNNMTFDECSALLKSIQRKAELEALDQWWQNKKDEIESGSNLPATKDSQGNDIKPVTMNSDFMIDELLEEEEEEELWEDEIDSNEFEGIMSGFRKSDGRI